MKGTIRTFVYGLLVAIMTVSTTTISTAAPAKQPAFTDIDQSYAKGAINQLVEQGIVNGIDDAHFNPKGSLTRAEFVAILVRALRLPIDSSVTSSAEFTDVHGWAVPYITSARHAGIVEGVGKGLFHPDGLLTREQAAKLLVSALNHSKPDLVVDDQAIPSFSDSKLISEWARPYVAMAAEHGLISGRPDGTFEPGSYANREMAAVMSVNLLNALGAGQGNGPAPTTPPNETAKLPAPTNFTGSGLDGTSMTFTWNAPANSAGIAGYDIFMGWDGNKIGSTTSTSFTVKNLDPNLVYSVFYVKSIDEQGRLSERSNEYIVSKDTRTSLALYPQSRSFTNNKEGKLALTISGDISQSDSQHRARLYLTVNNMTSKDISFGSAIGLGKPEIIQEGNSSLPLIVAWGTSDGVPLINYLHGKSYLNMQIQIPITIYKAGVFSTQYDLRTAGAQSSVLVSKKLILTGDQVMLVLTDNKFDIRVQMGQPQPVKANQQITIPVVLQGKLKTEQLTDLAEVQVRIVSSQILDFADIDILDDSKFGHANIEYDGADFLTIRFDEHLRLADLQKDLENGITLNLNLTFRKPGSFDLLATVYQVENTGKIKGSSSTGNVVQLTVQ